MSLTLALLLALLLSWDAPLANCDGSPLTDLDHYEVPVFRAVIIGWMPCDTSLCPIYSRGVDRMPTIETQLFVAEPGLGEVLGWEWPEAIDAAGNSSRDCDGPLSLDPASWPNGGFAIPAGAY